METDDEFHTLNYSEKVSTSSTEAYCLIFEGSLEHFWFPMSITEINEDEKLIKIPEWFIDKNDLWDLIPD